MWIPNIDLKLCVPLRSESVVYWGMILWAHTAYIYGRSALKGSSWQQDICMSAPGFKFFSLFSLSGIHAGVNGFLQPFTFFSLLQAGHCHLETFILWFMKAPYCISSVTKLKEKPFHWNDRNIHLYLSDKTKNVKNNVLLIPGCRYALV